MRLVRFDSDDPAAHLACDEVLLRRAEAGRPGECLRLYEVPGPAVVLGISGRRSGEVREEACRDAGVAVLRRASGGGAVVIGAGCLCYSAVLDADRSPELRGVRSSYRLILGRLVAALRARGLECAHAGLSDLAREGRKVGGCAQKRARRFVLHHGTLLHAFDTGLMERFLRHPPSSPAYRGGRPHGEFVANVPLAGAELSEAVQEAFGVLPGAVAADLSSDLADEVSALVRQKYSRDAWNLFRRAPEG